MRIGRRAVTLGGMSRPTGRRAAAPQESALRESAPQESAPRLPLAEEPLRPTFARERAARKAGLWPVAGCDEAGRGPLAGPVVAAAVILDPQRIPRGLDDSKKLTAEKREILYERICAMAEVGVAFGSPARIDRDNIRQASLWALSRAVRALPVAPQLVFVDGCDKIDVPCDCRAVISGDALVLSIAAASIVAKVTRDRLMARIGAACPGYGFERHMGYGVPAHTRALATLGPTRHHRQSFAPVRAAAQRVAAQLAAEHIAVEHLVAERLVAEQLVAETAAAERQAAERLAVEAAAEGAATEAPATLPVLGIAS
ncbi:Ribonuclease HII [Rhodovulum sp. PH10]|nr:Ribonuclease HII [Rhodovulum sp. PH10]